MKRLVICLYLGVFAQAKPSYPVHHGVGAIYKGPNAETIIEGPDGSVITAEADGGIVAVNADKPATVVANNIVSEALEPAVAGATAITTSVATSSSLAHSPILVDESPAVIAASVAAQPLVASNAVISEPIGVEISPIPASIKNTASLEGPSGSILRYGEDAVIAGPASTTIRDGKVVASIPNVGINTIVEQAPVIQAVAPVAHQSAAAVVPNVGVKTIVQQIPGTQTVSVVATSPFGSVGASAGPVTVTAGHLGVAAGPVAVSAGPIAVTAGPVGIVGPIGPIGVTATPIAGPILAHSVQPQELVDSSLLNAAKADASLRAAQLDALARQGALGGGDASLLNGIPVDALYRERIEAGALNGAAQAEYLANQQAALLAQGSPVLNEAVSHRLPGTNGLINGVQLPENHGPIAFAQDDGRGLGEGRRFLLAKEAERAALAQAINSGQLGGGHGLIGNPGLNPVITQGGHVISDPNVVSTTLIPPGLNGNVLVSSTPGPLQDVLLSSTPLPPIEYQQARTGKVLLSSIPQPQGYVAHSDGGPLISRPSPVLTSGNIDQVALEDPQNRRPLILQPDGVAPPPPNGLDYNNGAGLFVGPSANVPGNGGPSPSDLAEWRASVANGHIAAEAVLPKQIYRDWIH